MASQAASHGVPSGTADTSVNVHEDKEPEPDHVHEMPVPGDRLETEVIFRFEMALHCTNRDHREHDGAEGDVHAVETGQHEKGRAVDAGTQGQAKVLIGLDILFDLQEDEEETQHNRGDQPCDQLAAIIFSSGHGAPSSP